MNIIKFLKKSNFLLYIYGFFQLSLIAINTWFISKGSLIGAFISEFFLTLVFTLSINKLIQNDTKTKIFYSLSAAIGSLVGLFIVTRLFGI